jgi:phosphoribosylglycinamide formyltransferase-1
VTGRIVVLVSGSGSNLQALLRACALGEVPGEIAAVVADRSCPGLRIAGESGVPTIVVEPAGYPDRAAWSAVLLECVQAFAPSLVVSAGFMRILAPVFVDALYGRVVNLHPSLLPAFPGAHAVRDALAAGVKVTGTTVHLVDNEIDHGPIVAQEPVRVHDDDSEATLAARIKEAEHRMLPEACRLLLGGRVRVVGGRTLVAPEPVRAR